MLAMKLSGVGVINLAKKIENIIKKKER